MCGEEAVDANSAVALTHSMRLGRQVLFDAGFGNPQLVRGPFPAPPRQSRAPTEVMTYAGSSFRAVHAK